MLNDKSQGSVAALLRCGWLFTYHFTTYLSLSLVVKRLKLVNTWRSYRQKGLLRPCAMFVSQCPEELTDNLATTNKDCFCSCYITMQIIFDFSINKYQTNKYLKTFREAASCTAVCYELSPRPWQFFECGHFTR